MHCATSSALSSHHHTFSNLLTSAIAQAIEMAANRSGSVLSALSHSWGKAANHNSLATILYTEGQQTAPDIPPETSRSFCGHVPIFQNHCRHSLEHVLQLASGSVRLEHLR